MSTFNITSSTLSSSYEYSNGVVTVNGNFRKNGATGALQNLGGSVYADNGGEKGDYIGNFDGNMRDSEILYSLSEMSRGDSEKVWDAIDDIEAYVLGKNGEEQP